jgi:Flp pilus assembly protein TadG
MNIMLLNLNRIRDKTIAPVAASQPVRGPVSDYGGSRSKRRRLPVLLFACEEGQAAIETALVVYFILVPTLLGIFSVTMALFTYQKIGYATFEAAQVLGASRGLITDPCAQVVTTVATVLPAYPAGNFTYTLFITQNDGTAAVKQFGPTTGPGFKCSGVASSGQGGYALNNAEQLPVMVQIGYSYNWFPLFGKKIAGTLLLGQSVLVS